MNSAETTSLGPPAMTLGAPIPGDRPSLEGYVSQKTSGWQSRLVTFLSGAATSPFRPGKLDCALFFAQGVLAETGIDIAQPFTGNYRKVSDGLEILHGMGFEDHADYVSHIFPEYPSALWGKRGDGAVVPDMNGEPALGIIQGEQIYLMGLHGIGLVPLTAATRAFAI